MHSNNDASRREFLAASLLGVSAGLVSDQPVATAAVVNADDNGAATEKVCYAELLPHEFRKRLAARPIAYLPLGTLEWHGEHLAFGSDAIQSEGLMRQCARQYGGIVMPPIHLGPDRAKRGDGDQMLIGMDYADTTTPPQQLDGSCYWIPLGLHLMVVDAILAQLKRAGFRAVFADGHGPSRWSWVEAIPEREARFGLRLFGVSAEIDSQWKSQVDHAGRNETSLMMHLRPELVDLSQLPEQRSAWPQGVGGEDPREATPSYGQECLQKSVELVGQLFAKAGLL